MVGKSQIVSRISKNSILLFYSLLFTTYITNDFLLIFFFAVLPPQALSFISYIFILI